MTYSLHTLTNPTARAKEVEEPQTFWARFAQEIALLIGGALLLLCLLALLSYQPTDAAWTTSGSAQGVRNWVGRAGALLADLAYFGLGYSAWWCLAAAGRAWLMGLARWMRGASGEDLSAHPASWRHSRWVFWIGLVVLVAASASIEWARLYRLEAHLPGHSGGAVGYLVGTASVRWFGFTGAALIGITLVALAGNMLSVSVKGSAESVLFSGRVMLISAAALGVLTLLIPAPLGWFTYLYAAVGFGFSAAYAWALRK